MTSPEDLDELSEHTHGEHVALHDEILNLRREIRDLRDTLQKS